MNFTIAQTGLIVNEVSQGTGGVKEYAELIVIAPSGTCFVDIRNWIIDDNNGDFSGGPTVGAGIASGHIRFTNDPQWQNVPTGSIILIYNQVDKNTSITMPDDPSDSNNDKIYILPSNSSLLERCTTRPTTSDGTYSPCTYTAPIWDPLGLANDGDVMQVRTPAGTYFHGLSFGDGTCNCIGPGPGVRVDNCTAGGCTAGRVYSFTHNIDNNFTDAANYTNAAAPAGETPGTTNNAANTTWRSSLLCVLPLPAVTLQYELVGNQVNLRYQLTDGEYIKHLTLQHATNETPFENVIEELNYSQHYIQNLYDNKTHYYRIVYQDKDGNTKISNTVQVQLENTITQEMNIYPNPVPHDVASVMLKNPENGIIQVFNIAGQLIYQTELNNGERGHTIDVYQWQDGLYIVRFISQQGEILTQKMIVQSQMK